MTSESFESQVKGGQVRGTMQRSNALNGVAESPAIIICHGLHIEGDDAGGLFDDLAHQLIEAGVAVVRFEHRLADLILEDFDAHTAADELADALAVFDWMSSHAAVNSKKIGVLGFGLGAIAACGLAKTSDSINRICLLAPTTAEHVRSKLTRANGSPAALDAQRLPKAYLADLERIDSARDLAFFNRPTLIVHGAADRFIPAEVSIEYQQALQASDHDVQRVLIARADHAFSADDQRAACLSCISRFFQVMVQQQALAAHA